MLGLFFGVWLIGVGIFTWLHVLSGHEYSVKEYLFIGIMWPIVLLVYFIEGGIQFLQNIKK